MICRPCRNLHDGKPDDCQNGCTCQHHPHGSALPPPPPRSDIVGYVCNLCEIALTAQGDDCDCPDGGSTLNRTAIFKDDILEP